MYLVNSCLNKSISPIKTLLSPYLKYPCHQNDYMQPFWISGINFVKSTTTITRFNPVAKLIPRSCNTSCSSELLQTSSLTKPFFQNHYTNETPKRAGRTKNTTRNIFTTRSELSTHSDSLSCRPLPISWFYTHFHHGRSGKGVAKLVVVVKTLWRGNSLYLRHCSVLVRQGPLGYYFRICWGGGGEDYSFSFQGSLK